MRVSKTGHTNHDRQSSRGGITCLAKVAVQCSADTPDSYRDGENRHLCLDRKR